MIAREAGITASDRQCGIDSTGRAREARAEIDTRTRGVHCHRCASSLIPRLRGCERIAVDRLQCTEKAVPVASRPA